MSATDQVSGAATPSSPDTPRAGAGRRRLTSKATISSVAIDLFTAAGFDETSVDDVAEAAGIARRTLFRYYPSKNAIAWGDFDAHLAEMRDLLGQIPGDLPISAALREALVSFNEVAAPDLDSHRRRMSLLLGVPALQAHSMLMYADWRQVIAEFCAHRLGLDENDHAPQTTAWLCLGTALSAYEQWLATPGSDLRELIESGCTLLAHGVDSLT